MTDLKALTVKYLRELAKKHLVKGYSKLSKDELLDALKKLVPDSLKASLGGSDDPSKAKKPSGGFAEVVQFAKKVKAEDSETTNGHEKWPPAEQAVAASAAARPSAPGAKAARGVNAAEPRPSAPTEPRLPLKAPPPAVTAPGTQAGNLAEPVIEGFFVARVVGEREARLHHLTAESTVAEHLGPPVYDERLGDLPMRYEDDATVLLPRDPETLFFFWDFRPGTREEAARGLEHPRAVIRVFDGDRMVRELDFAFESRNFYVHGLPAGRYYRAEAHFIGRNGQSRRIGRASNVIALPALGPSSDRSVRYMRVPWDMPLSNLRQRLREGTISVSQREPPAAYIGYERVEGPNSASWLRPLPGPSVEGEQGEARAAPWTASGSGRGGFESGSGRGGFASGSGRGTFPSGRPE